MHAGQAQMRAMWGASPGSRLQVEALKPPKPPIQPRKFAQPSLIPIPCPRAHPPPVCCRPAATDSPVPLGSWNFFLQEKDT
jgi:hypothetical protein